MSCAAIDRHREYLVVVVRTGVKGTLTTPAWCTCWSMSRSYGSSPAARRRKGARGTGCGQSPPLKVSQRDIGYAMGYRIVQAFYEAAPDKTQAVRRTLGVTNRVPFLEASRYAETFWEPQ